MEETKEALNNMIINSDNPAVALDDAIGALSVPRKPRFMQSFAIL